MDPKLLFKLAWLPLVAGLAACGGHRDAPLGPTAPALGSESASNGAGGQAASELQGLWRLVRLEKAGQAPVEVAPSDRFTAEFANGRVALAADCNRCSGGYTEGAGTLAVGPRACTLAYCPSAPLDTDFAMLVSGALRWSVAAGQLTLRATNGTLLLRR